MFSVPVAAPAIQLSQWCSPQPASQASNPPSMDYSDNATRSETANSFPGDIPLRYLNVRSFPKKVRGDTADPPFSSNSIYINHPRVNMQANLERGILCCDI